MSRKEPPKPEEKEKQLRIFVSTVNTLAGQAIVENLRNDNYNDLNPHLIIGTIDKDDPTPACRGIKRIIQTEDPKTLMRVILDCDVIIYDALKAPTDEIQFVLKTLTSFNYTEPKTFILVSSVFSWSDTPPKEFIDENTGEAIEVTSIKTGKTGRTFGTNNTDLSQENRDPMKFNYTNREFSFRRALPSYEYLRTLENQAMAAAKAKDILKVYVLCSGVLYGNGEDALYDIIETAYQGEQPLVLIGDGRNKIPMIHAVDLSTMVKYLVHEKPADLEYINAIDFAPNRTQNKLIQTISEAMGGIEIVKQTYLDSVFHEDYNILSLNVNLIPTDILNQSNHNDPNDNSAELKGHTFAEGERKTYKWKYRSGLAENFDEIYNEYKLFRNLKTIKLGLTGLSSTHGSLYGEEIAKKLRIPFISYDKLVAEVQTRDDPIGKSVKEYLENEKARMVKEATEELEKQKAKKKKGLPDAINPDDYVPRLNLQMVNSIFNWRLSKSDIKNKGYVLEGYPVTKAEATELFIEKIPIKNEVIDTLDADGKEGETVAPPAPAAPAKGQPPATQPPKGGEPANPATDAPTFELRPRTALLPDKVLQFTADNSAELFAHLKEIHGEEKLPELKITQETVDQRVLDYNQKTTPDTNSAVDFFKEQKIEVIPIPFKNFHSKQQVIDFIGEKINFNFKNLGIEDEPSQESGLEGPNPDFKNSTDKPQKELDNEVQLKNLDEIKQAEQDILNTKSQALKQYITDNLLPALTSGLIEICNGKPEDPLEYLANYLIDLSQKKSTGN